MILFYRDSILYANASYDTNYIPKALRMDFDSNLGLWKIPISRLPQYTLSKVEELLKYADESAYPILDQFLKAGKQQVALSEAANCSIELRVPKKLEYMPFQKAGIAYALSRDATLIADEMGLGKTVQALGLINNAPQIKTVLIVCPASLKLNWSKEASKWLVRSSYIRVLAGQADVQTLGDARTADVEILIVNYDILEKVFERLPKNLDLLVADEAHYAKNESAKRAKALREVSARAKKKLFLTGTPILNRPIEIWNILDILTPGAWGSMQDFGIRYAAGHKRYVGNGRTVWNFKGASNLKELQEKLRRHIMVRRLKQDVLHDLPDKIRQIVPLEVSYKEDSTSAQRTAKLKSLWDQAQNADSQADYRKALEALDKEVKIDFDKIAKVRHEIASKKAPYAAQFIKDMLDNVEKVVVFAHHKDVVQHLAKALNEFGVVTLTGDTSATKKQEAVERFQKDDSVRVFIGNILAAGTGHTLTKAQHVVFAELDWVPGNVKQAEDRCHRIGQTDTVFVYHLVVDNSIDVILANTIVAKMEIEEAALGKAKKRERIARKSEELVERGPKQRFPTFTEQEQYAMRYSLCALEEACGWDKGFINEDKYIGLKLAKRARRNKDFTDKQYAYTYRMLRKYALTRLHKNAVSVLFPTLISKRKELHRRARRKRVLQFAAQYRKALDSDPLFGA